MTSYKTSIQTKTSDRDLDGIMNAFIAHYDDRLANTYNELWEIATEPRAKFSLRSISHSERSLSQEEQRAAKILRRLGKLAYTDNSGDTAYSSNINYIQKLLENAQTNEEPGAQLLTKLYRDSLAQIATMYHIDNTAIERERQQLENYYRNFPD